MRLGQLHLPRDLRLPLPLELFRWQLWPRQRWRRGAPSTCRHRPEARSKPALRREESPAACEFCDRPAHFARTPRLSQAVSFVETDRRISPNKASALKRSSFAFNRVRERAGLQRPGRRPQKQSHPRKPHLQGRADERGVPLPGLLGMGPRERVLLLPREHFCRLTTHWPVRAFLPLGFGRPDAKSSRNSSGRGQTRLCQLGNFPPQNGGPPKTGDALAAKTQASRGRSPQARPSTLPSASR